MAGGNGVSAVTVRPWVLEALRVQDDTISLVPAEGEGAVDQGLVAADGAVGADLEVAQPSSSLICL